MYSAGIAPESSCPCLRRALTRGDVIVRTDDNGSLTWHTVYEACGTRPFEWTDGTTGNPDCQLANTKDEEADIGLLNEGMRYRDLETASRLYFLMPFL